MPRSRSVAPRVVILMNSEIAGLLCGLTFLLAIVTVVGHVSWLFFAMIFRALTSSTDALRCNKCGKLTVVDGRCTACGTVPFVSVMNKTREELLATVRQLNRLYTNGHLSHEQCFSLLKVLNQDLARFGTAVPEACWPTFTKPTEAAPLELGTAPAVSAVPAPESTQSTLPELATPLASKVYFIADEPLVAEVVEAQLVDENTTRPVVSPPVVAPPITTTTQEPTVSIRGAMPLPPREKITPSRTLADMLQGFMEESNIRWGEVIAGLVIVISAIGLVISLRQTLQRIPYFPALLFLLFTVAFHSTGLYTLRRWNLAAVSRAILIIALLLVPLSFSAGVVLSGQGIATTTGRSASHRRSPYGTQRLRLGCLLRQSRSRR